MMYTELKAVLFVRFCSTKPADLFAENKNDKIMGVESNTNFTLYLIRKRVITEEILQ